MAKRRITSVQLPWPPSVNTCWRRGANVTYMSAKGREFREEAIEAVYDQLGSFKTLTGRLHVAIQFFPWSKRRFDVDNYAKAPLDALQHVGLIADDEQIDLLTLRKMPCEGKPGRCLVTLTEASDES